ncbi:hypothetical protein Q4F19_17560 [Sphingomonas sp. BIUV-7]|uniref:Uncharacterized protein n=1 Tax=Sphingomonas natans TaxID=3063330 RepID=A0ABT8YCZ2_9SPHN|nr:hypothetical protein [Sphingomonas sp. BIUV-7]MDO6416198.1 hypothetical protein [Sphingomonas sp. BIUV-7]
MAFFYFESAMVFWSIPCPVMLLLKRWFTRPGRSQRTYRPPQLDGSLPKFGTKVVSARGMGRVIGVGGDRQNPLAGLFMR